MFSQGASASILAKEQTVFDANWEKFASVSLPLSSEIRTCAYKTCSNTFRPSRSLRMLFFFFTVYNITIFYF